MTGFTPTQELLARRVFRSRQPGRVGLLEKVIKGTLLNESEFAALAGVLGDEMVERGIDTSGKLTPYGQSLDELISALHRVTAWTEGGPA